MQRYGAQIGFHQTMVLNQATTKQTSGSSNFYALRLCSSVCLFSVCSPSTRQRQGHLEVGSSPDPLTVAMSREILEASMQSAAGASGSGSTRRLLIQSEFYMTGVLPVSPEVLAADVPVSCTICVDPLEEGVVRLQLCGHLFHAACITRWFDCNSPRNGRRRGTCPNCRCELYVPDPPRGSLPVVAGGMDDSDGSLGEEDDEDSDWSEESVDRSPGPPHELVCSTPLDPVCPCR
ncbi:hypothetical protein J1614_008658 [Plenodomus biglobosus]|nr:hypothetical protein J1614_008658 [Plenodomus biglobosus]